MLVFALFSNVRAFDFFDLITNPISLPISGNIVLTNEMYFYCPLVLNLYHTYTESPLPSALPNVFEKCSSVPNDKRVVWVCAKAFDNDVVLAVFPQGQPITGDAINVADGMVCTPGLVGQYGVGAIHFVNYKNTNGDDLITIFSNNNTWVTTVDMTPTSRNTYTVADFNAWVKTNYLTTSGGVFMVTAYDGMIDYEPVKQNTLSLGGFYSKAPAVKVIAGYPLTVKCSDDDDDPIETVWPAEFNGMGVDPNVLDAMYDVAYQKCGVSGNNHRLFCKSTDGSGAETVGFPEGTCLDGCGSNIPVDISKPTECVVRELSCDGKDTFELDVRLPKIGELNKFGFSITAKGEFIVDWGDGNVEPIQKTNTNKEFFEHTLGSAFGPKKTTTVKLCGTATKYSPSDTANIAAVMFGNMEDESHTADKILAVRGSLGKIFPTIDNGDSLAEQPRFYYTFYNSGLTSIPENLFDGVKGAIDGMFYGTFHSNSSLTSIPKNLFKDITGGAKGLFSNTFYDCESLESIPENLFTGITDVATGEFYSTFQQCDKLKRLPNSLFPNITGEPTTSMFMYMFGSCDDLGTDEDVSYVPPTLFENLDKTGYNSHDDNSPMKDIFKNSSNLITDCTEIGMANDDQYDDNFRLNWNLGGSGSDKAVACKQRDCVAGEYRLSNGRCVTCTAGNYCPGGDKQPVSCTSVFDNVDATSDEGSDEITDCYMPCENIALSTSSGDFLKPVADKVNYPNKCQYKVKRDYRTTDYNSETDEPCNIGTCCVEPYTDILIFESAEDYATRKNEKLCEPYDATDVCPTGYVWKNWSRGPAEHPEGKEYTVIPENARVSSQHERCVLKQYTITYHNADNDIDDVVMPAAAVYEYNIDDAEFDLPTPTRTGYAFDGWYEDDDFSGTAITKLTPGAGADKAHEDKDYYAKWTPIKYNINYRRGLGGDGVTGSMENINNVEYDQEVTLDANQYVRPGYDFIGWCYGGNVKDPGDASAECKDNLSVEGGTLIADKATVKNLTATDGDDVLLGAAWEIKTYAIRYHNIDGATVSLANPDSYNVNTEGFTLHNPTKMGYEFKGWCDDASLTENCDTSKTFAVDISNLGDKDYYAKFEVIKYNITYKDVFIKEDNTKETKDRTDTNVYTVENTFVLPGNPAPQTYADLGWKFKGWFKEEALTNSVTQITKGSSAENKIFYAKWEPVIGSVDFVCSKKNPPVTKTGQVGKYVDMATSDDCGFEFDAWMCGNADITGNTIKVARTKITCRTGYKITYSGPGITNNVTSTGVVLAPNTYTSDIEVVFPSKKFMNTNNARAGYTFNGWYFNSNLTNVTTGLARNSFVGNQTVYAGWTPNKYSVTYDCGLNVDANSETPAKVNNIEFETNFTPAVNTCVKTGYVFEGWAVSETEDVRQPNESFQWTYSENKKLTAKWAPISYTIKMYTGIPGVPDSAASATLEVEYGVEQYLPSSATLTRIGYDFAGWCYGDSLKYDSVHNAHYCKNQEYLLEDQALILNLTETNDDIVVLCAAWNLADYTITYHNADDDIDDVVMPDDAVYEYNIDDAEFDLPTPTRTGYAFGGWYEDDDFSGTAITELTPGADADKAHEDKDYYAKWTPITYDINYRTGLGENGVTGSMENINDVKYDQEVTLGANQYVRPGYDFIGWCYGYNVKDPGDTSAECKDNLSVEGGTLIADKATVKNLTTTDGADVLLGAAWAPHKYYITYYVYYYDDSGWQDDELSPQEYNIKSGSIELATPEPRFGYEFVGWCTENAHDNPDCTVIDSTWTPTLGNLGDIPLYAKWVAIPTFDIEYVLNGGDWESGAEIPTEYQYGVGLDTLPTPKREHYTFAGWFTDAEFAGDAIESISADAADDITLYAKWEFNCESGKWLHIGTDANDKLCLYDIENKPAGKVVGIMIGDAPYYMFLTKQTETDSKKINKNSNTKLHVEIDGDVYNAHDASVL